MEWRGSSIASILFLTHNLHHHLTSLCCFYTIQCMGSLFTFMWACVTCLNTSKHRCMNYSKRSLSLCIKSPEYKDWVNPFSRNTFSLFLLWFSRSIMCTWSASNLQIVLLCIQRAIYAFHTFCKSWHWPIHQSTRQNQLWQYIFFVVSNETLHVQRKHITLWQLKGYSLYLRLTLIENHLTGLSTLFITPLSLKQHPHPISALISALRL